MLGEKPHPNRGAHPRATPRSSSKTTRDQLCQYPSNMLNTNTAPQTQVTWIPSTASSTLSRARFTNDIPIPRCSYNGENEVEDSEGAGMIARLHLFCVAER